MKLTVIYAVGEQRLCYSKGLFQLVTLLMLYFQYWSWAVFLALPLFVCSLQELFQCFRMSSQYVITRNKRPAVPSWHSHSASARTGGNLGSGKGMGAESPTSYIPMKNSYSDLQFALT